MDKSKLFTTVSALPIMSDTVLERKRVVERMYKTLDCIEPSCQNALRAGDFVRADAYLMKMNEIFALAVKMKEDDVVARLRNISYHALNVMVAAHDVSFTPNAAMFMGELKGMLGVLQACRSPAP